MSIYSNIEQSSSRSAQSHSTIQRGETPSPALTEEVANTSSAAREALSMDVVKATKKMNNYAEGSVTRIQRAENLFAMLLQQGQTPNTVTCNTLIKGYVNSGQVERALETLTFMRDNQIEPDLFTYNTLIHGCGLRGFVDQAFEMYNCIIQDNLDPDAYTLTNLINACIRVEDGDRMQEAIRLLKTSKITPTVVTFNSIIKGLLSLHNKEAAQAVFAAMGEAGIEPDAWTYGTIMQGLLAMGKYTEVIKVYHLIENPDSFHTKTAMDAYVKQGEFRKVIAFFHEEKSKITPNNVLYSILIRAHIKLGEIKPALGVLDIVEESSSGPNSSCFYPILMACTESRARLAFELFLRMRELGILVDAKATNKVIRVCTQAKKYKEASIATEYLLHLNRTQGHNVGFNQ